MPLRRSSGGKYFRFAEKNRQIIQGPHRSVRPFSLEVWRWMVGIVAIRVGSCREGQWNIGSVAYWYNVHKDNNDGLTKLF